MDERLMRFRVGVMFLATFIILAILLVMFGKLPNLLSGKYPVQVRFDYAAGVTKGTPVRKSGIFIGKVRGVRLTDGDSKVMVTLEIDSDKTIYQNEDCYITRDLLGDTAIAFIPNRQKPGQGEPIDSDGTLVGLVSDDPTGLKKALGEPIKMVTDTGEALTAASKKLGEAADRVEQILDDKTQKNVQSVLSDAAIALKAIRKTLGDETNQEKLSQAMSKLPDTLDNMNRTFQATEDTLRKFTDRTGPDKKTAIERMVDTIEMTQRTLRKFSESSDPGRPAPADQIATAMENISEVTTLIRTIMTRVEQGEGSLGALLNDRELYNRVNRAAKNIEDVSRELKPLIDDARVLVDKGARHPGVFLRDAVKPGMGIK